MTTLLLVSLLTSVTSNNLIQAIELIQSPPPSKENIEEIEEISAENIKKQLKRLEPLIKVESVKLKDSTGTNDPKIYQVKAVKPIEIIKDLKISVETESEIKTETGKIEEIKRNTIIEKKNQMIKEQDNEILLLNNENQIIRIENVSNEIKKLVKDKLVVNEVKPLIAVEKIQKLKENKPQLKKIQIFILQITKDKIELPVEILHTIVGEKYNFIIIKANSNKIRELLQYPSVIKVADKKNLPNFLSQARQVLKEERDEKIRELELKKSHYDLVAQPELLTYFSQESWAPEQGQTSPLQQFVMPRTNAVTAITKGLNKEQVYQKAISWTWMSDQVLHNKAEKWLNPQVFITDTPSFPKNPLTGQVVSDCSEQANALVSMLRSINIPAEDVRVVLGKVDFDGEVGGHAWVEIKEDGQWMVLDATSGPYYNESTGQKVKRTGLPYDYWKYHQYPVVEIWSYYNDIYFSEDTDKEVANGWSKDSSKAQEVFLNNDITRNSEGKINWIDKIKNFWWQISYWLTNLLDYKIQNFRLLD